MALSKDNRIVLIVGAGLAVVGAVAAALVFNGGRDGPVEAPPASMATRAYMACGRTSGV